MLVKAEGRFQFSLQIPPRKRHQREQDSVAVYCKSSVQEICLSENRSPSHSAKYDGSIGWFDRPGSMRLHCTERVLFPSNISKILHQHLQDTAYLLPGSNPSNIRWSQINKYMIYEYGTRVEVLKGSSSHFLDFGYYSFIGGASLMFR